MYQTKLISVTLYYKLWLYFNILSVVWQIYSVFYGNQHLMKVVCAVSEPKRRKQSDENHVNKNIVKEFPKKTSGVVVTLTFKPGP